MSVSWRHIILAGASTLLMAGTAEAGCKKGCPKPPPPPCHSCGHNGGHNVRTPDIKIGAPLYPFIEPGYRQINADQKEKLDAAIEALKSGGYSVLGEEWPSDAVSSHTILAETWTALVW